MKKDYNRLAQAYILGAALANTHTAEQSTPGPEIKTPKSLPYGVKEYHFKANGFITENRAEAAFSCIARNETNARRKFDNHIKKL